MIEFLNNFLGGLTKSRIALMLSVIFFFSITSYELRARMNFMSRVWPLIKPYVFVEVIPGLSSVVLSVVMGWSFIYAFAWFWDTGCSRVTLSIRRSIRAAGDWRPLFTRWILGPIAPPRTMMDRIKSCKMGLIAVLYTITQVKTIPLVISQFTIVASLLDLPQYIFEGFVGRIMGAGDAIPQLPDEEVIEAFEHGIEEMLPTIAMATSLTGCEIGSVKMETFLARMAANQRNADTVWKAIKPVLTQLGLLKDSQYETIMEISRAVEKLSDHEAWLKLKIRTCTVDLLTGEGQARVHIIRQLVTSQLRRLTTITTKDLLSDKGVNDCMRRLKVLEDLLHQVDMAQNACEFRVKPIGVCIWGEKQIGKTTMFKDLLDMITTYLVNSGNPAFATAKSWGTWSRQCRDEFDTNYRGQQVTYSDDAFQQKDNKDHLLWYSFISGTAVGTNQADLTNKGMPYTSKLVVTTCNNLPKTSVTVSDITALHARFPFTVRAHRKSMVPTGSIHIPGFNWLELYVGPMDLMVNFEPPTTNVPLPAGIEKVTIPQLAQKIANALISEESFYRSRLPGLAATDAVVEEHGIEDIICSRGLMFGQERLADHVIGDLTNDIRVGREVFREHMDMTKVYPGLNEIIDNPGVNLERALTADPALKEVVKDKEAIDMVTRYVNNNKMSFLAYNLLREMAKTIDPADVFYNHIESRLSDPDMITDSNSCLVREREKLVNFMAYKILTYQITEMQSRESTWKQVSDWTHFLIHKRTKQPFQEWVRTSTPTVTQFITTLHEWEVEDEKRSDFEYSFSHQLPLILCSGRTFWLWSPLMDGGSVIVPYHKMKTLSKGNTRIVRINTQLEEHSLSFWLQGGLIVDEAKHLAFHRLMVSGERLERSDIHCAPFTTVWYAIMRGKSSCLSFSNYALADKIEAERNLRINTESWTYQVQSKYEELKSWNKRLSETGMDRLISLFDSLGLPVNEFWRGVLMNNAQYVAPTVVGLMICVIIYGIIKAVQIRHVEEHSVSEKRPGKKPLRRRDVVKLVKRIPASEHGDDKGFETLVSSNVTALDTELLFDRVDLGREHYSTFEVIGYGDKESQQWGVVKTDFTPKYVNNVLVHDIAVTRERDDGAYYLVVRIREKIKLEEYEKVIERYVKTCNSYPIGEWTMELSMSILSDSECYVDMEYTLLNANLNGKFVPWTRSMTSGIDTLKAALCKGDNTPLEKIICAEHGNDEGVLQIANGVLDHNLVSVEVIVDDEFERYSGIKTLGIATKNCVILPAHTAIRGSYYRFTVASSTSNTNYYVAKLRYSDVVRDVAVAEIVSYDIVDKYLRKQGVRPAILTMSKEKRVFRDITHLFISNTEMSDVFLGCDTLHYFHHNKRYLNGRTTGYSRLEFNVGDAYKDKELVEITPKLISDIHLGVRGDCGGPVFLLNGKKKGALLGFYVQRSQNHWYSAYLCKEDFLIDAEEHGFSDEWGRMIYSGPPRDLPAGDQLKYVGLLQRGTLPASNTSLDHWKKSPFSEQFEEQLAPGRLDANDPYITGTLPVNQIGQKSLLMGPNSVMGKTIPDLDQDLLDWCVREITSEMILTFRANGYLTKVSDNIPDMLEYALNGAEGNTYVTKMEVKKAAGLPWSLIGWQRKQDMIDVCDMTGRRSFKKDKAGVALRRRVTTKLEQANQGVRIYSFSNSKLKDQCIKIAHARSGRTRVFHCIPVDSIIFSAALYGPFKEAYTKSRLNCYHAVGIDPKSMDWEYLVNYLAQHPNFFDADYSNYDKHLHRQMMFAVRRIQREVIKAVAPDNWDKAREIEELDSIDTYVVDYATVYQTNRANKSGSYLTTIDNCIANDVYGLYAWVKATQVKSLAEYRNNVCTVSFGDDIVKSVSDKYKDRYNYISYKEILEATGHIITPGNKDGLEIPITNLRQLQFLKRGFEQLKGYWVAPLLKRSIEGPFVWTSIDNSAYEEWKNLVQEQLYEAALHGEDYYNEFRDKLKKCNDSGLLAAIQTVLVDTWDNTLNNLFERYVK